MASDPQIVWPAPLLPALLEARSGLTLLVSYGGAPRELADWGHGLALRERRRGRRLELDFRSLESCEDRTLPGFVHGRAEIAHPAQCYRVRLEVPALEVEEPRSAAVLDLVAGETVLRRNCVGLLAPGREALRLAFASDLHVARIWDDLDEAVARHAADLHPQFLHPGRRLARFVEQINQQAARGEIDLVVFGGDLVDHVHDQPRGRTADGGNVRRFCEIASRLEIPAFALPGNHDFRLYPWRPRLPNLESVGLPSSRSRGLLRAAGLWDAWPVRLSDRDVLATECSEGRSGLGHHLSQVAPATDFALDVRGTRLIFASTGRDLLPRWRELEWARRWLLPRTLHTSAEDPDCEGLHDEQIRDIGAAVQTRGAALFMHAPLLHTGGTAPIETLLARLDPGDGDDLASRVAFERRLIRAGVRRGVFFRNPAPLLRALLSTRVPTAVFAGHVHRGTAAVVDRQTLGLRSTAMQAPATDRHAISLFTAPSLGQRRYRAEKSQPPGYLLARFDAGRLTELEQRDLL